MGGQLGAVLVAGGGTGAWGMRRQSRPAARRSRLAHRQTALGARSQAAVQAADERAADHVTRTFTHPHEEVPKAASNQALAARTQRKQRAFIEHKSTAGAAMHSSERGKSPQS